MEEARAKLEQGERRQAWLADVAQQLEDTAQSYHQADVKSLPVNEHNGVESRWRRHLLTTGPPQVVQALQVLEAMALETVVQGEGAMDGSVYGTHVLQVRVHLSSPAPRPPVLCCDRSLSFSCHCTVLHGGWMGRLISLRFGSLLAAQALGKATTMNAAEEVRPPCDAVCVCVCVFVCGLPSCRVDSVARLAIYAEERRVPKAGSDGYCPHVGWGHRPHAS